MRCAIARWLTLGALAALPSPATRALPPPSEPPAATSAPATTADTVAQVRAALARADHGAAETLVTAGLASHPQDPELHLLAADCALAQGRPALALARLGAAGPQAASGPEFQYRAARAYYAQGLLLGKSAVRHVAGGRPGQFAGGMLLVEPRPGQEQFLCCPPESALYALRQALDGGVDVPEAHVMHARIWKRLGRPDVGYAVLQTRAATLLSEPTNATLAAFAELALATGDLPAYLRYERQRAGQDAARGEAVLFNAFVTLADAYAQRGDERLHIEWLARAVRLRPDDAATLLRLADAEQAAGMLEAARVHTARVLELDPTHPERSRLIARVAAGTPPGPAEPQPP